MRRIRSPHRAAWPIAWAACLALACSNENDHPPDLGNCVPVGDASCKTAITGAGSGTGPGGEDGGLDGSQAGDASGCGVADTLLTITSTCESCIQGSCCLADQACTGDCLNLLECMLNCMGDPTCINVDCDGPYPLGSAASNGYNDFRACLSGPCSPECPTLPSPTSGDF